MNRADHLAVCDGDDRPVERPARSARLHVDRRFAADPVALLRDRYAGWYSTYLARRLHAQGVLDGNLDGFIRAYLLQAAGNGG